MPTYERFIFESYNFDARAKTIALRYSLDETVHFEEVLALPAELDTSKTPADLDAALFALHLSGGVSYFKTYLPKIIEIRSGQLTPTQAAFWNRLYTYGLGEFFYQNQIDFRGLINFPATVPEAPAVGSYTVQAPRRVLVPFGGGKDSIVTTEILRGTGIDQTLLRVKSHPVISDLATIAKLPILEADRTLAPNLLELQQSGGAYQGHVPITAHLSFLSVIIGLLGGYNSVFFSNERSSSYGNVDYLGIQVNHQWSKSLEFEVMMRGYLQKFVTREVQYLNVIRPLSELHIAKIFTGFPAYFGRATSCNRNWTQAERAPDAPIWCGQCPKCAFSFALMAAYLPAETVINIFGHNLYEDESLLSLYRELWGVEGFKPFECVGTPEEAKAATSLALDKPGFTETFIARQFREQVSPSFTDARRQIKEAMTPQLNLAPTQITNLLNASHLL